ncbi:MAG: hypothetical protein N2653_13555 [Burkholderiales bacterium]|nr:hypothetical protein [Burkholderiales bacterium]
MSRLAFLLVAAVLSGCAAIDGPKPLSEQEIVALVRAGRPSAEIVEELKRTGTVLFLGAGDILRLHEAGVPRDVLEHLQRAQMEEIHWRARSAFGCCGPLYRGVGPCPWPAHPLFFRLGRDPWGCY